MAPSGVEFDLLKPDPATVHIGDIAHHLSQICRFTGATRVHYSVAQHSVHACDLAPPEFKLAALLHDAAEAYVGDVSSPVKALIGTAYVPLEQRIARVIFERFGVPVLFARKLPMVVKRIDLTMLEWEQRDLLPETPGWLTTLIYMLVVATNKKLGLEISDEMLMTLAGLLGGYIVGESYTKGKTGTEGMISTVVEAAMKKLDKSKA